MSRQSSSSTVRSASVRKEAAKAGKKFVLFLHECILLLAMQVVTVTYVAGLTPPGGVWPETKGGHLIGNPILSVTEHVRYVVFSCGNAAALVASAAVALLLLCFAEKRSQLPRFCNLLRHVMLTGTVALAVAYAAGATGNNSTTIFVSLLVAFFSLCAVIYIARWNLVNQEEEFLADRDPSMARYMLTAIFVATMTYTVGLSPPGGFWQDTQQQGRRAGDPALLAHHRDRFQNFFTGNTVAFVISLSTIPLILTNRSILHIFPHYCNVASQLGLWVAYAMGTNVHKSWTVYGIPSGFIGPTMLWLIWNNLPHFWKQPLGETKINSLFSSISRAIKGGPESSSPKVGTDPFFILLFTTLSASMTYQAGLNPPGGLWPDDHDGHKAFDPILLTGQPRRYMAFTYFNTLALVASLVAMIIALTERCQKQKSRVVDALLVLDMMGLIGAYATGCCRDLTTSLYVVSLGGAMVAYVVFHMAFFMSRSQLADLIKEDEMVERERDLMLGILGASLTYQSGLSPPGGFTTSDDVFGRHLAGEPALLSTHPTRYKVFFYLNSVCFMASIFLNILLFNPLLYRAGIRCYALLICMLVVFLSLLGAYTAGSYRNLVPSIGIIAFGVVVFVLIIVILCRLNIIQEALRSIRAGPQPSNNGHEDDEMDKIIGIACRQRPKASSEDLPPAADAAADEEDEMEKMLMYLVTIGCVGTTATYIAGFAPPRGFWPDDSSSSHAAGDTVLLDTHADRYRVFLFFNTTAFAASSSIMSTLPLLYTLMTFLKNQERLKKFIPSLLVPKSDILLSFLKAPTSLHVLGILVAYATGSTSGWNNKWVYLYAAILIVPVLFCIFGVDWLCQSLQAKDNKASGQHCCRRHGGG